MRFRVVALFVTSCLALAVSAQPIITGEAAGRLFVYQGKPVQPFCLDFPVVQSDIHSFNLAECSRNHDAPTTIERGFLRSEVKLDGYSESVQYKVLAKRGDQFLVAAILWGGGSGIFSSLEWVRLMPTQVILESSEMLGDRCEGGFSDVGVTNSRVEYFQNLTPIGLASLAGIKPTNDLAASAADCYAVAHYRYDVATKTAKLVAVNLNPARDFDRKATPIERCFEQLVAENKHKTFTPAELPRLGNRFNSVCRSESSGPK